MLNKILEIISSQKISTIEEIVEKTGQDKSLVQVQVDLLRAKGLVQCETIKKTNCSACPLKTNCKLTNF